VSETSQPQNLQMMAAQALSAAHWFSALVTRSLRHKLLFEYASRSGVVIQGFEVAKYALEIDTISVNLNQEQLGQLLENCKTVEEFRTKLFALKLQIEQELSVSIAGDFIIIALNIWNICSTYGLLARCSADSRDTINFIQEKSPNWNLLFDQISNWSSISEMDKMKVRNMILQELLNIERKLSTLRLDIQSLDHSRKIKFGFLAANIATLLTGIGAYTAAFKMLGIGGQICCIVGTAGLSAATLIQVSQTMDINEHLSSLREHADSLIENRDMLDGTHMD